MDSSQYHHLIHQKLLRCYKIGKTAIDNRARLWYEGFDCCYKQ